MWKYKGKEIKELNDIPDGDKAVGFVYVITNKLNGRFYIGKKNFKRVTKKKRKGAKRFTHTTIESNWLTYCGSSQYLSKDIKELGIDNFDKEILMVCYSKKTLTYYEMKYQIDLDVLRVDSYNGTILGKFFRRDLNI